MWLVLSMGGGAEMATDVSMGAPGMSLVYVNMERSGCPMGNELGGEEDEVWSREESPLWW